MLYRRFRVISSGQFTEGLATSTGAFIGAQTAEGAAVVAASQVEAIAIAIGAAVEAVEGDADPWDGSAMVPVTGVAANPA
jgi:hypothetical protein